MYFFLSDTIKTIPPIPSYGNVVAFSTTCEYTGRLRFRGLSLKMVNTPFEDYMINGQRFKLKEGKYLMANHLSEGLVHIAQKKRVEGICLDVGLDTLNHV